MSNKTVTGPSITVLLLHHAADELTRYHYELLKKANESDGGVRIVPICFAEYRGNALPGSYVACNPGAYRTNPSAGFHRFHHAGGPLIPDLDCLLWDYVMNSGQSRTDRIILVEGDMLSRCRIREFFGPSFRYELSGSMVRRGFQENRDWYWYNLTPPGQRRMLGNLVASVTPVCGIQMSWDLAEKMALLAYRSGGLFDNVHVEMAIGTMARMLGVEAMETEIPGGFSPEDFIHWNTAQVKLGPWGLFHPVKTIQPSGEPAHSAGAAPKEAFSQAGVEGTPPPKALWLHHTVVINDLLSLIHGRSYLEIGMGEGTNFSKIRCSHKISVDPAEGKEPQATPTHRMSSDAFFAENTRKFDLIFIDGLHTEEQVGRDLRNALAALNPDGLILCHDLNPTTKIMQEAPRQTGEWTGDGWKAWVRLRAERPDLRMLVIDADYGMGIILPARPGADSGLSLNDGLPARTDALTWEDFEINRQKWLNLMPPQAARDLVIAHYGSKPPLTVITLWRAGWNGAQQKVLDWLCSEAFPEGTRFVWTAQEDSETAHHLQAARKERLEPKRRYAVELVDVPRATPGSEWERHALIAGLYNEVFSQLVADLVLLVEDDVVPQAGSARLMMDALGNLPPDTAAIMGAYRSRQHPECVCAHDLQHRYIPWNARVVAALPQSKLPSAWIGGGFTLHRTAWLKPCLPLIIRQHKGWVEGWDMILSSALRVAGAKLWVMTGIQAKHLCPEVVRITGG